jgi:hypothetical protein
LLASRIDAPQLTVVIGSPLDEVRGFGTVSEIPVLGNPRPPLPELRACWGTPPGTSRCEPKLAVAQMSECPYVTTGGHLIATSNHRDHRRTEGDPMNRPNPASSVSNASSDSRR